MHGRAATRTRFAWVVTFAVLIGVPGLLAARVGRSAGWAPLEQVTVHTGMAAFGLLVLTLLLVARLPSLVSVLGIERILRAHRTVAVTVVGLVVVHVGAVVINDPRGLGVFDLAHTTNAARAATVSTAALAATIAFSLRRRRRQPRYEGWRMLHVALAIAVFSGAWLHVWWLRHLSVITLMAGWFVAMAVLMVAVVVRRWFWLPARSRRHPYVVQDVVRASGDAVTVAVTADGHDGIPFRPGQFAYLKVGHSPFVFEEHPFSISSTAVAPHRKEFTIKALGDFSELLSGLRPGRQVYVDGAYGALTTEGLDAALGFVFVAGGIGVTPMISMLRTLADRGDRRRHLLLMGARTPGEMLLRAEVGALRSRLALDVVDVVETAPHSWAGEAGRIDRDLLDRFLPRRARRHLEYFVCGPPLMVMAVTAQLRSLGVTTRRIHTERFEVV